ncbi:MAG: uL30 family ribosomal protein, partial [Candidatus Heimdallarchaeota archaeon]
MSKEESKVLAVIRIRSMIDQPRTIRHALKLLNLMRT